METPVVENVTPPTPRASSGWAWTVLAVLAPLVGVVCIAVLIWALGARLDRWEVQGFVLLIYGAVISAVSSSLAARQLRRAGVMRDRIAPVRRLLWAAVIVALLWVWFPPFKTLVYWYLRYSSMFRFV